MPMQASGSAQEQALAIIYDRPSGNFDHRNSDRVGGLGWRS